MRRQEHRQLIKQGDERMKGSKYHWLRNRSNMSWHQQRNFSALRQSSLKTARAWAIKEFASRLWEYRSRTWAYKGWFGAIRMYGPEQPWIDKVWRPGEIELVR